MEQRADVDIDVSYQPLSFVSALPTAITVGTALSAVIQFVYSMSQIRFGQGN